MTTLLIVLAAIIVIVVLVAAARLKQAGLSITGVSEAPVAPAAAYELAESLFSPAERSFFGVLETLDFEGITIMAKVRLADVFNLKKGLDRSERQRALNRISAKHVDFLLIRKTDGRAVLGIELDDASHQRPDRQTRDAFLDDLFAAAGLPLVHIPAQRTYNAQEITAILNQALAKS